MEKAEIDRKLAELIHPSWYLTTVTNGKTKKTWKQFVDPKSNELVDWNPSEDMGSAWEVAERFGLVSLERRVSWSATFVTQGRFRDMPDYVEAEAETAPLAICKAALNVIEGDE